MSDDFLKELEAIQQKPKTPRKKKKNSKAKGKNGEKEFCDIMNKRFPEHHFMKTQSSGGIIGGSNYLKRAGLDPDIIAAFASDIVAPKDFVFSVEHKAYSPSNVTINTHDLLFKDNNSILEWWEQCVTDSNKAKKLPMLVVKIDYQKRFCVMNYTKDLSDILLSSNIKHIIYKITNRGLLICELEHLLTLDIMFWGI